MPMTLIIDVIYFCFLPNWLTHHRCRWKHGRECVYGSAFSLDKVSVVGGYRCCRRRRRCRCRLRRQRFIVAKILLLTTNESTCNSVSNSYMCTHSPKKSTITMTKWTTIFSLSGCDGMPKHLRNFIIEKEKKKKTKQSNKNQIKSNQINRSTAPYACVWQCLTSKNMHKRKLLNISLHVSRRFVSRECVQWNKSHRNWWILDVWRQSTRTHISIVLILCFTLAPCAIGNWCSWTKWNCLFYFYLGICGLTHTHTPVNRK